jgi:hypothetical protein
LWKEKGQPLEENIRRRIKPASGDEELAVPLGNISFEGSKTAAA